MNTFRGKQFPVCFPVMLFTEKGDSFGTVFLRSLEGRCEMVIVNERISADHTPKSATISNTPPDGLWYVPRKPKAVPLAALPAFCLSEACHG